jgi:hypothetical protein
MTAPLSYRVTTIRGRTLRFTKVDPCGVPIGGAAGQLITRTFASLKQTANYDGGTEIKVPSADDTIDVYEPGNQTLLNYDLELQFSVLDTAVVPGLSGNPAVLDWQEAISGWEELALTHLDSYWALEMWSGVAGQRCSNGQSLFGYNVFPFIGSSQITVDDTTNKESLVTIKGSTFGPNAWGKGPYEVVALDEDNTPSRLLVAMDPKAHKHFDVVTIDPPAMPAAAGWQTLTLPTPY